MKITYHTTCGWTAWAIRDRDNNVITRGWGTTKNKAELAAQVALAQLRQ